MTTTEAGTVPGYFILGELDNPTISHIVNLAFAENRAGGAPWAIAVEPVDGPIDLRPAREEEGWLGNPETFAIALLACYDADRGAGSWFPSRETAVEWQAFVSAGLRLGWDRRHRGRLLTGGPSGGNVVMAVAASSGVYGSRAGSAGACLGGLPEVPFVTELDSEGPSALNGG